MDAAKGSALKRGRAKESLIPQSTRAASFKRLLGGTSWISPDNRLVLARRKEVGTAPVAAATEPAVSMADDGACGAVYGAWDVTTARRKIGNDLTPAVIPRDE